MSEIIPPEVPLEQPDLTQAADSAGMESRMAEAEPALPTAEMDSSTPMGEAGELQNELGAESIDPALEADGQVMQAQDYSQQNIEVTGFDQSGVMGNDDVQKYLHDNLPPEHLDPNHVTDITYTGEYKPVEGGNILGRCSTDTSTGVSQIEIYNQTPNGSFDRGQMEQTLTHEVGHNVYYNLPPEARSAWDTLSGSSQPGQFVSDYAQTNAQEDFAETYASYIRDPELLNDVSPQKSAFMRANVFNGRVYG